MVWISRKKPFYHGFRPLPLSNLGKLLISQGLGYRPFKFWGNSCKPVAIGDVHNDTVMIRTENARRFEVVGLY